MDSNHPGNSVLAPDYAGGSIADVIPATADALGYGSAIGAETVDRAAAVLPLGEARSAVVVLVDGLGAEQLRSRAAHAPFLRGLLGASRELSAGFPSTTANSLSSLGTGQLPGGHGVVGYRVLDPDRDVILNQLSWDQDTDPKLWVPDSTLLERLTEAGLDVVSLGEAKFAERGLNQASMRGGRFRPSRLLGERAGHAIEELKRPGNHLVYLYWGALDKVGHQKGSGSWAWLEELERIDAELRRLAEQLPRDTLLVITADHGMVDVAHDDRLDLAAHPALRTGVRHVGGEPRAVHLYTEPDGGPGLAADLADRWLAEIDGRGAVLTREQAISAGLFGVVGARARSRIGDVVVTAGPDFAVVDTANDSASALALLGHHGGLSTTELRIPLLTARS
ncbi:alkaline phosphatase family protein [Saxibacter everestensis]|uniref:Alkaline phosphatase family protein n=1 Tax=Saxibacter everestensis TaxID=2909229 RepID=A0ABY8QPA5_9MICO|nr:alkaline phosphatase family protein [Brevibacteriaceae bacterium ZFBP1038]